MSACMETFTRTVINGKTRYKLFELQKLASVKQNYLL